MNPKDAFKDLLGELPLTVEIYWLLRQKQYAGYYSLRRLEAARPQMLAAVEAAGNGTRPGKRIALFASWHYWIEYCAVLGLALAGQGHRVTLGYLPYSKIYRLDKPFDLRRHDLHTADILKKLQPWLKAVSMLHVPVEKYLPPELEQAIDTVATFDTQYTLQVEDVDKSCDLYRLRYERNELAIRAALTWLRADRPDLMLIPNSSILEYNMVYRAARYLDIPMVTFEFNENHEEMWLAQNDDVMRQNTDSLWAALGGTPLTPEQRAKIEALESARMGARTFGNSERLWQDIPPEGALQVRQALGLDARPLALLATNVLGDSLILGREIFTRSMAEWITRTIQFFAARPDLQLVIRIHPGERFMTGPSMVEVVKSALPGLPENIHLVEPLDKVNTYDLMGLSRLGLVYTTTTGLEMAMNCIPVIVAAQTHYRGRGFTLDPANWDEYFAMLEKHLAASSAPRLTAQQSDLAWRYAYHFFFTYPFRFPWQLGTLWKDLESWPMARVLGDEGRSRYGQTIRYLAGEPINWKV